MKRVLFYTISFVVISCMMAQCKCTYPNPPLYYIVLEENDNPAFKYIKFIVHYQDGEFHESRFETKFDIALTMKVSNRLTFNVYNKDSLFIRDTTITLDAIKVDTCSIAVLIKVNADTTFSILKYPRIETTEPRKTVL